MRGSFYSERLREKRDTAGRTGAGDGSLHNMVDKARARSAGSVGLGLAICEEIAMLHGAGFSLESEEGKGTCVHLFY